jgi:hypothetical protein
MTTPRKFIPHTPSKERFSHGLKRLVEEQGRAITDDFDIDDIHWATDRIGITDYEGCSEAVLRGYFTINVAGEIDSSADVQADINPGSGTVQNDLTELVALMDQVLTDNAQAKIVVHCAMGMERSPLTVVWYLHTKLGKTLDEAYDIVMNARASVVDRRSWINS